jgi:Fe-Mn family superoxide dismutase
MASHVIHLPFDLNGLEPYISAETLDFHYNKHHKGYGAKLQELTADTPYAPMALEEIIQTSHTNNHVAVYNNAAQIWNHNFYWKSICPPSDSKMPTHGHFFDAATRSGGLEKIAKDLVAMGMAQFASGWAWLVVDKAGQLAIRKTSNADPVWLNSDDRPLLIVDVWEHAYYLDYQNRRAEYLEKLVSIINWSFSEQCFASATSGPETAHKEG